MGHGSTIQPDSPAQRPKLFQRQIFGNREVGCAAGGAAILRHIGHPCLDHRQRRRVGEGLAGDLHFPCRGWAQTADHLSQFTLPIASHPGHANNLAGAHVQREMAQRRQLFVINRNNIVQTQAHWAWLGRRFRHLKKQLTPDHQARQFCLGHPLCRYRRHRFTSAQNGNVVGNRQHFVQLVADEDNALAGFGHGAQRLEQPGGLLWGQHGGRLIKNQNLSAPIEHFEDLYPLLFAHRELPDAGVRVNRHAILHTQPPHIRFNLRHLGNQGDAPLPQDNIFGHRL